MSLDRTYMASELIQALENITAEHGDLPVYADDADTDWRLSIGVVYRKENKAEEWPERIEIKTDYHGKPKGGVEVA